VISGKFPEKIFEDAMSRRRKGEKVKNEFLVG